MKILLISILLLSSLHAQYSTPLSEAFTKGKVLGNITLFSYNIDREKEGNANATALGGFLKYTIDDTNPLFASVRFHQSSSIGEHQNKEATQLFNNDKNASNLTVISESFIAYKYKDHLFRVGNMMLNTPMMNDDITRIVPWSYQGVALTSEILTDTKLQLNYISAIRENTSDKYKKESASGKFDKGISMLGVVYEGIEEFNIQSFYYYAPELYNTFIAQIDYQHVFNEDFLFCIGTQYFKSSNGGKYNDTLSRDGGDDIDLLALKTSIDGPKYNLALNYSQNFGLSGIVKGYGGLAKVYTTSMIANGRGNFKPETWMLKSRFDLDPFKYGQTELALWLTRTRVHDVRGNDFDAYYSHLRHYFNPDTSVYLRFESINYHNTQVNDTNHLRLITAYNF